MLLTAVPFFVVGATWRLPDTYHSAGSGRGTATLKFYDDRDILREAVRLGFVQSSVASQLQMMERLSQWLADAGLDPAQATPEVVQEFVQARRRRGYTDAVSRQGLGPLLSYLRSRSIIPPALQLAVDTPAETLLAQFGNYLVRERGLAAKTVRQYVDHSRIFLRSLPDPLTEALAGLTASQVTESDRSGSGRLDVELAAARRELRSGGEAVGQL